MKVMEVGELPDPASMYMWCPVLRPQMMGTGAPPVTTNLRATKELYQEGEGEGEHQPVCGALVGVWVGLGQLHLYKVKSVLANISRHFLDRNGTLTDCIEGLWIVVVLEIC